MSKKTLLEEATIRKMMKLANIEPLVSNFLDRGALKEEKAGRMDRTDIANKATGRWLKEEEELEEGHGAYDRDEEEVADLGDLDEPAPPEAGPEDPAPDLESGPVDVVSLVDAIADAIEAETGVSVDVEGAGAEGEGDVDLEEPLGADEPLDAPPGEEELMEDEVEEDLAAANITLEEDDDLINEITRRVARRLLRKSAK